MKQSSHGVKQKGVQCACKHLTLSSYWNASSVMSTAAFCVCVCQDDKKMRGDRHNSCIMIVTSEPFMIYLCILFGAALEMFC